MRHRGVGGPGCRGAACGGWAPCAVFTQARVHGHGCLTAPIRAGASGCVRTDRHVARGAGSRRLARAERHQATGRAHCRAVHRRAQRAVAPRPPLRGVPRYAGCPATALMPARTAAPGARAGVCAGCGGMFRARQAAPRGGSGSARGGLPARRGARVTPIAPALRCPGVFRVYRPCVCVDTATGPRGAADWTDPLPCLQPDAPRRPSR